MDPLEVRREEVYPETARDGQERPAAEAIQRREEPDRDAGADGSEAAAEAQTEPGHAASIDR